MIAIPLELFIIFGFMAAGSYMDRRDAKQSTEWQLILDRLHHGTPIKPYDWELEN
jgi:hypothetical protein